MLFNQLVEVPLIFLQLKISGNIFLNFVFYQVVNRIQKLRKKVGLEPTDVVEVYFEALDKDSSLEQVLNSQVTSLL